jgi:glyoxylase-like metal-dependent hydrolase (beta-lactamase superfamily II)
MKIRIDHIRRRGYLVAFAAASLLALAAAFLAGVAVAARSGARAGSPGTPYKEMPALAPVGVRVDKYLEVPESAAGPPIDPARGYRTQKLGDGLYLITEGVNQSMFMIYEDGVVLVDAPPAYAEKIPSAVAEFTDQPITHIIYSHHHADHIGGAKSIGGNPVIIAHRDASHLLRQAQDPNRPLPTVTFDDEFTLEVGSQVLELSYHGAGHSPGNIFIHAPKQRTLMVVDVIFPGWMPWRRLALAQDVRGYFEQVAIINKWDFDTLVGGHVGRTGTRADVGVQSAFIADLKAAAERALKATTPGEGLNPLDRGNPWAVYDHFIDRVVVDCVNQLTPKWSTKLAGFDVYIWDQCYAMEQSLRID